MAVYQKKRKKSDPSYKKRTSKYFPLVRKLEVKPSAGPYANPNSFIRVDKVMSEVNKRLYRQHMIYRSKVSINTSSATQAHINVYALAPSWFVLNALRKAKETFDDVTADELEQMGRARWHDFRISLGGALDNGNELSASLAIGGATGTSSSYSNEYRMSDILCSDGNTRTFVLNGASSTSQWNVIEEYDRMGNTPEAAGSGLGGYTNAQESVDNANVQELQGDGDQAPYDDHMTNIFVKVGEIYRDTNGNQSFTTGYFDAPLGLIWLEGLDPNIHTDGVQLEIAAGSYKGVDAHGL